MLGLYIHIPFCLSKCNYCDFLSFTGDIEQENQYIAALIKEIKLYGRTVNDRLASVYIGGGTPSLLSYKNLGILFDALHKNFQKSPEIEITFEANPGTLSQEKAELLKEAGVNRISLGVQSMQRDELLAMGRVHGVEDVLRVVDILNKAGLTNYSFDFIYGLPRQNSLKLIDSLNQALKLKPKHISLYGLKIEEGTPWETLYRTGRMTLPNEDETAEMFDEALALLEDNGFLRYEISNYAKRGFESKHNLRYWLNEEYLGLGLGASSYYGQERFVNAADINEYLAFLAKGVFPVAQREKIDTKTERAETVFLGLRLIEGLERARFQKRFGKDVTVFFPEVIKKFTLNGLLELTSGHLRLSRRGLEVANEVMLHFLPD